jgi:hypothetical protein
LRRLLALGLKREPRLAVRQTARARAQALIYMRSPARPSRTTTPPQPPADRR